MRIELKKLTLVNFQGAKYQEIEFGSTTDISGANKTGKTTIFDAFLWLLFGKDSEDRKDFGVKTWDENGIVIPKIDHEVTGILVIDNTTVKLSRILKEKWQRPRGKETAEFTGNETSFFINDVPKSQTDFQNYISGIIPETTFKLLTSPTYFSSLKWDVRREMLISIAGEATDEETAGTDLVSLLDLMRSEKKSIEKLKSEYAVKKKKLNEALEQIPTRIDENNRDTPEPKDFAGIEGELNQARHNLQLTESEILDQSKGTEELVRLRSEKLIEKNNLEQKVQRFEFDARNTFANSGNVRDNEIRQKKEKVLSIRHAILIYEDSDKKLTELIEALQTTNGILKEKYTKRNAETLDFSVSCNCPTCGQSLPDDFVEAEETKATNEFNQAKVKDLNTIVAQANDNKTLIQKYSAELEQLSAELLKATLDQRELESEIKILENTPVLSKSVEAILAENADYVKLKAELDSFIIPEIAQAPDTTELKIKKVELSEQIRTLEADLRIRERIAEKQNRHNEIEAEGKQLAQQIASLEKIEFQIETFMKRKMNEVESRVNELFPTLKFRMFNQTIEGNDVPACDCLVNGVPWPKANTANRINAGIEIINVFSKVHNCYAPVFVDNSESINQIIPTLSQLITLTATLEPTLTIRT